MTPLAIGLAVAAVLAAAAFLYWKRKPAAASTAAPVAPAAPVVPAGPWPKQASTATANYWTPATVNGNPYSFPCPPGVVNSNGDPAYCIIPLQTAQAVCEEDPACTGYLTLDSGGWANASWLTGGANPQGVLLNTPPATDGAYSGNYYAKPS